MKSLESQKIAGFLSLGFIVMAVVFFAVNYYSVNLFFSIALSIPVFFTLTFMGVNYLAKAFVKQQIKPIYKSINEFAGEEPEVEEPIIEDSLISHVDEEVATWMHDKTQEIHQLRQMEKYRKEFLGDVSHELKTPIFNIQGYILTLLEGGIDDADINMLYLSRTEKSIDRMISIIENLEAISKLEAGELELYIEPFNLSQVIDDVFELQEIRAIDKKITLNLGKNNAKNIQVQGDKQRIFQVISNLVVNSINYGNKGGTTTVSLYDMDNRILVEIKDNGIGIPSDKLPRIFERFFRVDKSRSRDIGGTGLGLAIVKHIIEAHNQRINVNSTYGKGTSFTFTLEKV